MMPLFELYRTMTKEEKENPETTQSKRTSIPSVPSSIADDDEEFGELIWDNGPIMIRSQSSKPRGGSNRQAAAVPFGFGPNVGRQQQQHQQQKGLEKKFAQFDDHDQEVDPLPLDRRPPPSPSKSASDQRANFPVDEALPTANLNNDDYMSEFLNGFVGLDQNILSAQHRKNTTSMPVDKNRALGQQQLVRHVLGERLDSPNKLSHGRPGQVQQLSREQLQSSQLCRNTVPASSRPGTNKHVGTAIDRMVAQQDNSNDFTNTKFRNQQSLPSSMTQQLTSNGGDLGVENFSHFLWPAARAKSSLGFAGRSRSHERISSASDSKLKESTLIDGNSACKSTSMMIPGKLVSTSLPTADAGSFEKTHREVVSVEQAPAAGMCQADPLQQKDHNNAETCKMMPPPNMPTSSFVASISVSKHEGGEDPEGIAAASSSSSSSGFSGSVAPNQCRRREKRKFWDKEDSSCHSKDKEDDSVGIRRPVRGRGRSAKRSRAAEVHNLSERRRRDRINEKMRALQELIPNCNKVDKASMLEEAIEYLKTLQMQVQMMSMASGLYMPQMILPRTMQPIHLPTMPYFPSLGIGMGYGLGFGLGTYDMNSSPMPASHFPLSSGPGQAAFHGMPGSLYPQMLGLSGQGVPMPMSRPSPFNILPGLSLETNLPPVIPGITQNDPLIYTTSAKTAIPENHPEKKESTEAPKKPNTDDLQIPTSNQAGRQADDEKWGCNTCPEWRDFSRKEY